MPEMRWTPEQAAAIRSASHTLLAASAGTGKTTTVIGKILWRLGLPIGVERDSEDPIVPCPADQRLTLDRIAAITFTEKAAHDLKSKLREAIARFAPHLLWDLDQATIGTIHGFCGDLLREHALRLGIDPSFTVLDEVEARLELDRMTEDVVLDSLAAGEEDVVSLVQRFRLGGHEHSDGVVGLVRDMLRDLRWHPERYAAWSRNGALSAGVLRQRSAGNWDEKDDLPVADANALMRMASKVGGRWERHQNEESVRDFDSLILSVRDLLRSDSGAAALAALRRRLGLLIIDEFQDTDGAQRDIAFAIAGIETGTDAGDAPQLFLVGDPKQSIYRFRGADIEVWNEVSAAMAEHGVSLDLTENFRSTPPVIEYVNRFAERSLDETAVDIARGGGSGIVRYTPLRAIRDATAGSMVEWMDVSAAKKAEERRKLEAEMVAARIRDIVIHPSRGDHEGIEIVDPNTRERRACSYRDVAILFRSRTPVEFLERGLQRYGVPYYLAGDAGLTKRLEINDLVTVLQLVENLRDDVAAFGFLRSPFVGLRDEVIARIRFEGKGGSLRRQARDFLERSDGFHPSDRHDAIAEIERDALRNALDAIEWGAGVRTRMPSDQLLEQLLDRTGYRLHLLLMDQPEPKLANIQRFLSLLGQYRHHTVGSFLEMWRQLTAQDLGIPQAPLYSKSDDVVTLSTIHSAKGLEWPVVFLVDTEGSFRDGCTYALVSDRYLGPAVVPKKDERGPRCVKMAERAHAEMFAEEARLLYVAATRARDIFVITAPRGEPKGLAGMLGHGRDATRVTNEVPRVEIPPHPPLPDLTWIDRVDGPADKPILARPAPAPPARLIRSATELMTRARDRREWSLKYEHGVVPEWKFAATPGDRNGIPRAVTGDIVHGVLERIQQEAELDELLDLAIGALDTPELTERLATGTEYRRQLEHEIRGVVRSAEWQWYVTGEHYRELRFVHLRRADRWRVGAFDLYRPAEEHDWIVDFKTHETDAETSRAVAEQYRLQAAVYRAADRALAREPRIRFHFTKPNAVVDV